MVGPAPSLARNSPLAAVESDGTSSYPMSVALKVPPDLAAPGATSNTVSKITGAMIASSIRPFIRTSSSLGFETVDACAARTTSFGRPDDKRSMRHSPRARRRFDRRSAALEAGVVLHGEGHDPLQVVVS